MLPFLNNRAANVLLVGSNGANLLVWQKRRLRLLAHYEATDAGRAEFESVLSELHSAPFSIVMDVIEEDFRNEIVAHVTGSDRKALLNRKLNQLFRTTPYKTARVVGREKKGRKDDRIFLTALTKPEILDPWLDIILAQRLSVRAITSSAFVMERLARFLSLSTQEHVMIVNDEEGVGLRQTYLQKGRVVFSRLTPASVQRSGTLDEFIEEQSTQTRKYLERIKQLPYDVSLDVYVFTPLREFQSDKLEKNQVTFHFCVISELGRDFAINEGGKASGALEYAIAKAFKKGVLRNVYGQFSALRYFVIEKVRQSLYFSSILIMAGALFFLYPNILDIRDKIVAEQSVLLRTAPLRQEYDVLRADFPETPIPSGKMELVVETYDRITSQAMDLNRILDAVGSSGFVMPELRITKIDWNLEEVPDEGVELIYTGQAPDSADVLLQKAIAAGRTVRVITIEGLVTSSGSRRESRERVIGFVEALAQETGLSVTPLVMPLDLNSASSLRATLDNEPLAEEFLLEVRSEVIPQ